MGVRESKSESNIANRYFGFGGSNPTPALFQQNFSKFDDAYKRYMRKVPRMNSVVGAIQLFKRRGTEPKVEK